ncbi:hypothetical protein BVX98_02630 [bacterium F11]|nr:hypothetical protein BVX98_02630 [bacterium F11]
MSKKRDHGHDKGNSSAASGFSQRLALWNIAVLQFVCPILFFTNLTRNPYYTQIALLNISISLCALIWVYQTWRSGIWRWPRVSFEAPLLIFLIVGLLATGISWWAHEYVRFGIVYEGIRIWVFTLTNCCIAFYLPFFFTKKLDESTPQLSIWADIVFCVIWGFMWFGFHTMKNPNPNDLIWDPYGAFLWVLAILYAVLRIKDGHTLRVYHVIFSVAMIAGGYGLLQYMGRDIIWSSPVQPYGGRPVSSFGNPNFMSSYLLMVCPIATVFGFRSQGKQAWGYFLVAVICVASALGTLTRSTYVGLLAAYLFLGFILYKKEHLRYVKWAGIALGCIFLLILIFPATPVKSVQSPLARFQEVFEAIQSGKPYAPWHQRILIWSSAWDMVQERPLFGKGWGCFELFYPFYQGQYMLTELFARFRTHANNAHNILLEVWAQVGFIGTGLAILLMTNLFWGGWIIFRSKKEGLSRFLVGALLAGFVGMMVDNFFGNVSIFFAVPAFLFWWNMGALYKEADQIVIQEKPVSPGLGRGLLFIFGVFCLLVMGYFVKRWNQEVYYFKGFKASKAGQVEVSYKNLEKAFGWFEGEVNSNYELGNSYSRFAKVMLDKKYKDQARRFQEKAGDAYYAAIKANPGYDEVYFNLGIIHSQLGEKDKAIEYLEMALFMNPLLKDAYTSLANLYLSKKDYATVAGLFEKAVLTFSKDEELWINLGFVYTRLNEEKQGEELKEKAYRAFREAYRLNPQFKQAYSNLSLISKDLGRSEPLLEVPLITERMKSSLKQRDYASAYDQTKKLVALLPDYADAHLSHGNILFYLERNEEAIEEIKTAIKLKPGLVDAHMNLGKIYIKLKKFDLARRHFSDVLKYDRKNAAAKAALASLPE